MKILHVTIANPQSSQGGLNRYCKELMDCEADLGHTVSAIYPGKPGRTKNIKIRKITPTYFTISGALPVAITYGIDNPERYMVHVRSERYKNWLQEQNYDMIHVHSIQGIHKEFFLAAKLLNVPMIFTTHDYYPICMKCNLVDSNNQICEENTPSKCHQCNAAGGLKRNEQMLMQSNLYRNIKKQKWCAAVIKYVQYFKKNFLIQTECHPSAQTESYSDYNIYRKEIFDTFSFIHCNSFATKEVYKKFFPHRNYAVIPITHAGLNRRRKERMETDIYNIGFLGGMSRHKGYYILENALQCLEDRGITNWTAWFYGGDFPQEKKNSERRKYCKYFTKSEEDKVWDKLNILIVPSQWHETFGFVVLEALCRGIPVICSDLVGSKYFVEQLDECLIFQYNNVTSLVDALTRLLESADYYNCLCKKIETLNLNIDMKVHTERILEVYANLMIG